MKNIITLIISFLCIVSAAAQELNPFNYRAEYLVVNNRTDNGFIHIYYHENNRAITSLDTLTIVNRNAGKPYEHHFRLEDLQRSYLSQKPVFTNNVIFGRLKEGTRLTREKVNADITIRQEGKAFIIEGKETIFKERMLIFWWLDPIILIGFFLLNLLLPRHYGSKTGQNIGEIIRNKAQLSYTFSNVAALSIIMGIAFFIGIILLGTTGDLAALRSIEAGSLIFIGIVCAICSDKLD